MLLLKSQMIWKELLKESSPFVILPASFSTDTEERNKKQAHDLAVTTQIAGHGVSVLRSAETSDLFVCVRNTESQSVDFARKMIREWKTSEPYFLFRRDGNNPLLQEFADRNREPVMLSESGFILPDGRRFSADEIYNPAQYNTAWLHHRGYHVGEHL